MISIVLWGGGRLSFLSGQGFTASRHPELVSGAEDTKVGEFSENRFRTKFGMTNAPCHPELGSGSNLVLIASGDNFTPQPCRKFGFTLAEVLITLGIIGIVAAMTLPAPVNNTKGKELETQYKKAYSIITQAVNRMNAEQGFVANWSSYAACSNEFAEKFSEYFMPLIDCGKDKCSTYVDEDNTYVSKYKTFNGNSSCADCFNDGQFILADSMFVTINHCFKPNKILIAVDINGVYNKPNRYGHDFFVFQIIDDGKVLPLGAKGTQAPGLNFQLGGSPDTQCNTRSNTNTNGVSCAYKASTDSSFFSNLPK